MAGPAPLRVPRGIRVHLAPHRLQTSLLIVGALALTVLMPFPPAAAQPRYQYPDNLDVPFVPTNQPTVEAMLRIANVGPGDFVIDLGSGDGRILITAARERGARGFGVDLDPRRVEESLENARAAGVADRVNFHRRNLFDTSIADATVVTMYLLPRVNLALRPRLLAELKPGTRVVSHDFHMEDWKADLVATVRGYNSTVYFWVVPAQVAGKWNVRVAAPAGEQSFEIELAQKFQEIEGYYYAGGKRIGLRDARLDGDRISFVLVSDADYMHRERFEGRVNGNVIEGVRRGDGSAPRDPRKWTAARAAAP